MIYDEACELLGLSTPKSLEENAKLAETRLKLATAKTPLRIKVACKVLIDAANEL